MKSLDKLAFEIWPIFLDFGQFWTFELDLFDLDQLWTLQCQTRFQCASTIGGGEERAIIYYFLIARIHLTTLAFFISPV